MENEIFILCCDTDGGTHGTFSSFEKAKVKAEGLIEVQPFSLPCEASDFYIMQHFVDSDLGNIF